MAVIHVLDKHTAELIAAGEVVERPASVVKELVENSIDAGAHQITVTIESGGVRLIEVSDDGSGIETEYVNTAFIRHATSKIQEENDLYSIRTLGFRGEALASIASVARVEVLTKTQMDEFACSYRIEGGEELGFDVGARGVGTTIRVKDLFFNTPARMKFLKKDSSEGTFVADVVNHAALSHPEIRFKFVREGKVQYTTPGDGQLRSAVYTVLGKEFARDLLDVAQSTGPYTLHGLVTPPRSCRGSRGMQVFFINGRYVKNRTMMAALESAYKGTTMQGKFPGGVLMLDMPPDLVDVNVHPAKTEVRFSRENDVFESVYHAVKTALTQTGANEQRFHFANEVSADTAKQLLQKERTGEKLKPVKQSDFTSACAKKSSEIVQKSNAFSEKDILPTPEAKPKTNGSAFEWDTTLKCNSPVFRAPVEDDRFLDILPGEEEMKPEDMADWVHAVPHPAPDTTTPPTAESAAPGVCSQPDEAESICEEPASQPVTSVAETPVAEVAPQEEIPDGLKPNKDGQITLLPKSEQEPLRFVGEIFHTYIITERGNEICLIDKHAAHERILYEQLAKDYGNVAGQLLLAPVAVNLTAAEKQAVLDHKEMLLSAGMDVDDFGGNTVVVREVPCDVEPDDVENLLVELADKLAKGSRDAVGEKTEWVLHSIACRAAIKAGNRTKAPELLFLAEEILSGKIPPFCPHGRPCILKLTRKELEKQFGRLV